MVLPCANVQLMAALTSECEPKCIARMQKALARRIEEWTEKRDADLRRALARDRRFRTKISDVPLPADGKSSHGMGCPSPRYNSCEGHGEIPEEKGNLFDAETMHDSESSMKNRSDELRSEEARNVTAKNALHDISGISADNNSQEPVKESETKDSDTTTNDVEGNKDSLDEFGRHETTEVADARHAQKRSINDVLKGEGGPRAGSGSKRPGAESGGSNSKSSLSSACSATSRKENSKPKDVIQRVEEEHAEKVAKLNALKAKLGEQLDGKSRAALLNMKESRRRVASESKNSAPKGDFTLADPW